MRKVQSIIYILVFLSSLYSVAQVSASASKKEGKQIKLIHADFSETNEMQMPGVKILRGNIEAQQDSMYIYCNTAYLLDKENYIKLFGQVKMIQNDTIEMLANYAEYNGKTQIAYASGNVIVTTPNSKIKSEKIYYNRANAEIYYNNNATIQNKKNQLKSREGRYFVNESKYEFRTNVVLTNPTTIIKTNYLDYFDDSGYAMLKGNSTIENENHFIYTEDGFYDTKQNIGILKPKSYILYNGKKIEADELYYNKDQDYFRGNKHVKVTDTVNRVIATSDFAEVFRNNKEKDSIYLSQLPLVKTIRGQDSIFYHSKEIFIVGKDKERRIIGKKNVRMFHEPNISALADSLHYNQKNGLAELIHQPIVFRGESQITGDKIELLNNIVTEKLDSIKVLNNAFIIQKDTLGTGYNQAKGIDLFGRFENNDLVEVDLIKNAEMIYYIYNEDDILEGIDKSICSRINLELSDNKIVTATRFIQPQSTTYPPDQFPESARLFPGFDWKGDLKINSKEEIFDKKIVDDSTSDNPLKENAPPDETIKPEPKQLQSLKKEKQLKNKLSKKDTKNQTETP